MGIMNVVTFITRLLIEPDQNCELRNSSKTAN